MSQAGWYPDPLGRFEQRYFDGTQWTEHVAHGGAQTTDPRGIEATPSAQDAGDASTGSTPGENPAGESSTPVETTAAAPTRPEPSVTEPVVAAASEPAAKSGGRPGWVIPVVAIAAVIVVGIGAYVMTRDGAGGGGTSGDPLSRAPGSGDGLLLGPDGVGVATFDDPGDDVIDAVTSVLGSPNSDVDELPDHSAPVVVTWTVSDNVRLNLVFRQGDFEGYTLSGALTEEEMADPGGMTLVWSVDGATIGTPVRSLERNVDRLTRCHSSFGDDYVTDGSGDAVHYTVGERSGSDGVAVLRVASIGASASSTDEQISCSDFDWDEWER